jgi:hypothetical protein
MYFSTTHTGKRSIPCTYGSSGKKKHLVWYQDMYQEIKQNIEVEKMKAHINCDLNITQAFKQFHDLILWEAVS